MDVTKVNRDVAHVTYLASVFKDMLQALSKMCNKCFMWILHMFHTYVVSVLSGCCICFTHMLQVFYLDIAYVFTHMLQQYISNVSFVSNYVASNYFVLQVFRRGTMSDGRTARTSRDGVRGAGGRTGAQRAWGRLSDPAHVERDEGTMGKERSAAMGAGCACEAGQGRWGQAAWPSRREERRAQRRGQGARASRNETDGGGLRGYPDTRVGLDIGC
jgi:hypothetical protein